jgi:hypothetical protein
MMPIARLMLVLVVAAASMVCATFAHADGTNQDSRAIEVMQKMSGFSKSIDHAIITATTFSDARLGAGLIVSNSTEVKITISRPGSLQISSFDGEVTRGLFFHEGLLTVFNTENKMYAQAEIPKEIDDALEFALEELDVEAPLMDFIYRDASARLINSDQEIRYLSDKVRVAGVDCHHIAIRGVDVDVQLWVEEGDRPLARKIMITSKWEGGTPRHWSNLNWDIKPAIDPEVFEFHAPDDATKIQFTTKSSPP